MGLESGIDDWERLAIRNEGEGEVWREVARMALGHVEELASVQQGAIWTLLEKLREKEEEGRPTKGEEVQAYLRATEAGYERAIRNTIELKPGETLKGTPEAFAVHGVVVHPTATDDTSGPSEWATDVRGLTAEEREVRQVVALVREAEVTGRQMAGYLGKKEMGFYWANRDHLGSLLDRLKELVDPPYSPEARGGTIEEKAQALKQLLGEAQAAAHDLSVYAQEPTQTRFGIGLSHLASLLTGAESVMRGLAQAPGGSEGPNEEGALG